MSHCLVALVLDDDSIPSGPRTPQDPCQLHRYTTTPQHHNTCTLSHCLVALVLDDDSIPSGPPHAAGPVSVAPLHHNTCTLSHCLVALVLDDDSIPSGPRTPQDQCQLHRYTTTPQHLHLVTLPRCSSAR
ncbi:unnamed protein product [Parnassius apollo]|uniref:(apollo) hypothetical protein n=1 Tax=Parnassius apollo TaxID=110799 RepID=A0A8S3Y7Q3_PARAO|nr:unnamed protein product [Parnassius apollo]